MTGSKPSTLDVLVVDDSAVMRAMVIKVLRMSGLPLGNVHQAGDGASALDLVRREHIDLALVDINMPVMSGDELIDRIRADAAIGALPIVVISTERGETRVQSFARRSAAYVAKPFTPDQVRAAALHAMELIHA
jgi:two-component system, chemotaxis family, chemotaxis protein CheY